MKEPICGYCPMMRPDNGYCRIKGLYVNFFDRRKCFTASDEKAPEKAAPKPRKKRSNPLIFRTEKQCPTCGRTLPLDAFVRSSRAFDGRSCYCKECNAEKTRRYKHAQKEKAANAR